MIEKSLAPLMFSLNGCRKRLTRFNEIWLNFNKILVISAVELNLFCKVVLKSINLVKQYAASFGGSRVAAVVDFGQRRTASVKNIMIGASASQKYSELYLKMFQSWEIYKIHKSCTYVFQLIVELDNRLLLSLHSRIAVSVYPLLVSLATRIKLALRNQGFILLK